MGGSDNRISNGGVRSVALVGRSGNGKSATGNSILGAKLFESTTSSAGVTTTSELQTRVFEDGLTLHVIDTPGFFASSATPEYVAKEVAKCIHMADQLDAVLVVFSLRNRFNDEENTVVPYLKALFGEKVYDYLVLVFTGGDDLEENEETLDQYLARGGSQPLQDILQLCQNRKVLFNNRTTDDKKKSEQIEQLLAMVNEVMNLNGGRPFTDVVREEMKRDKELFSDLRKEMSKEMEESVNPSEVFVTKELFEGINSLEQQLGEVTTNYKREIESQKKQLEEERAATLQAEVLGEELVKSLQKQLEKEKAARKRAELSILAKGRANPCNVL